MIILAAAASCGLLFYAFWSAGPTAPQKELQVPKEKTGAGISPGPGPSAPALQSAAAPAPPLSAAPRPMETLSLDAAAKQKVLEEIHVASISYDPVELPRIQPYLTHSDPEVREAALNGFVVLGHAHGGPLLRDAARKLTDPKEAAKLLEKADWLELPSIPPEVMRARLLKKAARPAGTGDAAPPVNK